MKIIVCGGTGFIGRQLIPALLNQQHEVTVIGRDANRAKANFSAVGSLLPMGALESIIAGSCGCRDQSFWRKCSRAPLVAQLEAAH